MLTTYQQTENQTVPFPTVLIALWDTPVSTSTREFDEEGSRLIELSGNDRKQELINSVVKIEYRFKKGIPEFLDHILYSGKLHAQFPNLESIDYDPRAHADAVKITVKCSTEFAFTFAFTFASGLDSSADLNLWASCEDYMKEDSERGYMARQYFKEYENIIAKMKTILAPVITGLFYKELKGVQVHV